MALNDIKVTAYHALPCEAQEFVINGVEAWKGDFGDNFNVGSFDYTFEQYDDENWACANNQFVPHKHVDQEVLVKYGIDESEYRQIQNKLKEQFAVGRCFWCV